MLRLEQCWMMGLQTNGKYWRSHGAALENDDDVIVMIVVICTAYLSFFV